MEERFSKSGIFKSFAIVDPMQFSSYSKDF